MDYEKAYKEARQRMKDIVVVPKTEQGLQLLKETVFPELAESEDERIRRELVDFVNHYRHNTDLTTEQAEWTKKAIAYLEKQKEQKPAEWSEEDEALFGLLHQCVCRCVNDDRMIYSERERISKTMFPFIEKLQALRSQPKQEWGEEDETFVKDAIEAVENYAIAAMKAELERRKAIVQNAATQIQNEEKKKHYFGIVEEYVDLLAFLDTLPEQPDSEEKFRNFLDAAGDCGFSQDDILLLMSLWKDENAADEKVVKELSEKVSSEITRQVEDAIISEGLENFNAAFDKYMKEHWTHGTQIKEVAKQFYELGCRRTAEKYDEIEYNRQRAEEAEITKGLEEEIKRFLSNATKMNKGEWRGKYSISDIGFRAVARHFAEWGAEHLKK